MMHSLVEKYRRGVITDDHFVVECLHMVDPENPGLVLSSLSDDILYRIARFAREYSHNDMVTNYGVLPAQDQVLAAGQWIENSLPQQGQQAGLRTSVPPAGPQKLL